MKLGSLNERTKENEEPARRKRNIDPKAQRIWLSGRETSRSSHCQKALQRANTDSGKVLPGGGWFYA